MRSVWLRWLRAIAVAHVLGGVLMPVLLLGPARPLVEAMLLEFSPLHAPHTAVALFALFGPTVASWGVLFFCLVGVFDRWPSRFIWWSGLLSILVWAPYDSLVSWLTGWPWFLVLNMVAVVSLLVPWIAVFPRRMLST